MLRSMCLELWKQFSWEWSQILYLSFHIKIVRLPTQSRAWCIPFVILNSDHLRMHKDRNQALNIQSRRIQIMDSLSPIWSSASYYVTVHHSSGYLGVWYQCNVRRNLNFTKMKGLENIAACTHRRSIKLYGVLVFTCKQYTNSHLWQCSVLRRLPLL